MTDNEFCVCLRRRLLFEDPAAQGGAPCANRAKGSTQACGSRQGQRWGSHCVCCEKGPGFCRRHHNCRDDFAGWCSDQLRQEALKEQHVPSWDKQTARGTERAVLDVVLPRNPAGVGSLYVDISVAEPTSSDVTTARARARRPGLAAADREREKHRRYPGGQLLAAVMEAGGRWGQEFRRWAKAALPPGPERAAQLASLRQLLAVSLQRGVAAQLLSASAGCQRPWAAERLRTR